VKRFLYLLLGTVLFISAAAFARMMVGDSPWGYFFGFSAVLLVLVPWAIYGSRLSQPIEADQAKKKAQEIKFQSDWRGGELVVGVRWIKTIFMTAFSGACLYGLVLSVVNHYSSTAWILPWDALGFIGWLVAIMLIALIAWSWLTSLIGAAWAGYSCKVDSQGFHLSGMPVLPFSAISRVGYNEVNTQRGFSSFYLLIELNSRATFTLWGRASSAMWAGYLWVTLGYFVKRLKMVKRLKNPLIQIHAGHWNAPAPMIVAAIRHVSEKNSLIPVLEYSSLVTLQESREEHRLMQLMASRPYASIEEQQKQAMYQRFASGQRLTDRDNQVLDDSFAALEQKLKDQKEAYSDFSRLQKKIHGRRMRQFKAQIDQLPKVFALAMLIALLIVLFEAFS
jgi:hypothetical protein